MCKTCKRENCSRRRNKGLPKNWSEDQLMPDGTQAKKGNILVAVQYSGTGEGLYAEDDVFEGKEYICLGIYECNGPCVYVAAESCGNLGMSQCKFRIKKETSDVKDFFYESSSKKGRVYN